jgi:toxin ParE1/3/4
VTLAIRLSPLAQADLDDIWDYTVAQWDEGQAQAYVMGLDATMKLLAQNPRMGTSLDDIRIGYFKFPAASHLLIYRLRPDAIEFMRILHQRMDVERHV